MALTAACPGSRTTTGVPPTRAPSPESLSGGATLTVGRTFAELVVPVEDRPVWRWWRADTPASGREYRWEAEIAAEPWRYRFGVSLFKPPGSVDERSGGLRDLVQACQKTVWRVQGKEGRMVDDLRPWAMTRGSAVVVQITDPNALRMLFGSRPETADVIEQTPDAEASRTRIAIRYPDGWPRAATRLVPAPPSR